MQYRSIPGLEKPVSRLVQGVMGKRDDSAMLHLDDALAAGINTFDTARVYGDSDAFLGRWMQARGNREQVVILAKGAHHSGLRRRVHPFDIAADLHDSLAAMQTDYVDLWVLHRDDENVPVEQIVDELNRWVKAGKVRAFGGSNWSTERLQAANDYAKASGQVPFALSSPNFSLARQLKEPWDKCVTISGPENQLARDWYAQTQLPLFTWSSLAGGFMAGRFTREGVASGEHKGLTVDCYASEDNFQRLDRVAELAKKKGVTVPQLALAYTLNTPMNLHAIIGPANKSEIDENLVALDISLTPEESAYLDLRD